nr:hypothetical protein GCM10020093_117710 [Planobispora longispora]
MDRYMEVARAVVAGEAYRRVELLGQLASSAGAQTDLTANDFNALTHRLAYRGLAGISEVGLVVPADDSQVRKLAAFWRSKGSTLNVRTAPGDDHRIVVLSRPLDGLSSALGSDLAAAAEPVEAMDVARRTGQVTASQVYVLLRDRPLPPRGGSRRSCWRPPSTARATSPTPGCCAAGC